jgi:hypothetical protein
VFPQLALAEPQHGSRVARVHQQLESADALQRYNLALRERVCDV